jgi:hypothetical protein
MRELRRSVEAVGTLDPNEEVSISNQVEGTIRFRLDNSSPSSTRASSSSTSINRKRHCSRNWPEWA